MKFVVASSFFDIKFHRGSKLWIPYAPITIVVVCVAKCMIVAYR